MAKPFDIKLGSENELLIERGDFVIGDAEAQNLDHLLITMPGSVKSQPATGIGAVRWIKRQSRLNSLFTEAKSQLKADGWENESIDVVGSDISIQAEREE